MIVFLNGAKAHLRLIACWSIASLHLAHADSQPPFISPGPYRVVIEKTPVSDAPPHLLLGVHSLWWGHQNDLWIPGQSSNYQAVSSFLEKVQGIVRYGGGANEIPWSACTGPLAARKPVKAVDWAGPMPCLFGVPEYLQTMRKAGNANAWLIANIAGIDHLAYSETELQLNAGAAADSLKENAGDFTRYWELGNELERGRYQWSPEMIGRRASLAGQAILRQDAAARLVVPMIEYNASNQPPRKNFNERLLKSVTQPLAGIALHLYYDGAPGGPSIPTQINTVVETAEIYRKVKGNPASIWITEHGRWPEGDPGQKNWKSNWYKTNDMEGVLGTADFLIALSQVPEVTGAMLHGVRAGPWNVFDKTPNGPTPSGVGRLLLLFADTAPAGRLRTKTTSENQSGYKGGYDMRAAAFDSPNKDALSVWLINRASNAISVNLDLRQRTKKPVFLSGSSLICPLVEGKCSGDQYRTFPVSKNQVQNHEAGATVSLPANSVNTFIFDAPQ